MKTSKTTSLLAAGALFTLNTLASSHREAPLIAGATRGGGAVSQRSGVTITRRGYRDHPATHGP